MATDPKSASESIERRGQMRCDIDENGRIVEVLLLAEFAHEQHSELRGSSRKQPHMEELVRFRINSCVEPAAFVVELNHGFVDRCLTRRAATGRLEIGLFDPVADGSSTSLDTQRFEILFGIRE